MKLLNKAQDLLSNAGYTVAAFEGLVELQNQATGIEATLIGDLIETLLTQAPLEVITEITRANSKSPRSGWGLRGK